MRTRQEPGLGTEAASAGCAEVRRALGRLGEQLAASHLERLDYTILARNVRTRFGEIDAIAFRQGVLVFVEVKTRRACGRQARPEHLPLPGLRPRQCARLRRLAAAWLSDERGDRPRAELIRFDAIGVLVDQRDRLLRLDHLESAW